MNHKYIPLTADEKAGYNGKNTVPYKLKCRKCGQLAAGIPLRHGCKGTEPSRGTKPYPAGL